MAFFRNDSPPGPESGNQDTVVSHSSKSAPLFKQEATGLETLVGSPLSLSAYLSQHLSGESSQAEAPKSATPAGFAGIAKKRPAVSQFAPDGQFLNSLDVELAAGLEQYLPTPLFRLRVVKKRLDDEIHQLQNLLNRYSRLPNPSEDIQERVKVVRHRLLVLKNHERKVNQELKATVPLGFLLYTLSQSFAALNEKLAGMLGGVYRFLITVIYGRAYLAMESAQLELQGLQDIFESRMQDQTTSSAELGQILNRYEQTLVRLEKDAGSLSVKSLHARLWQEACRLVK